MTEPRVIERRMPLEFTDGTPLSPVLLRWTAEDPAAVILRFGREDVEPGHAPEWVFARDLLLTGLVEFDGFGDVQVWPVKSLMAVHIALGHADDKVTVRLPWAAVQVFLRRTYRVVRKGEEKYDIDGLIAQLLEGAQS